MLGFTDLISNISTYKIKCLFETVLLCSQYCETSQRLLTSSRSVAATKAQDKNKPQHLFHYKLHSEANMRPMCLLTTIVNSVQTVVNTGTCHCCVFHNLSVDVIILISFVSRARQIVI
jgi:hypothetical protein